MEARALKKITLGTLISIILLFYLPSCAPAISPEEYTALQSNLDNAQRKVDELTEDMAALRAKYESLQSNYDSLQGSYKDLQANYDSLQGSYEDLQANYNSLLKGLGQSALRNPTWSELEEFLKRDDTDTMSYIEDGFDCTGFALTLRDHAWRCNIRCAYVEVGFSGGKGHALNVFETADKGLIYIDTTEADKIAYVEINHPYGTIPLEGVKLEYIDCSGNSAEFWAKLTYSTHPNPFGYDYYLEYQRRWEFYEESIETYNQAVLAYNSGSTRWSYSQLTTWHENLEALEQDLGSIFYEPMQVINSIEVYWN